ncbi:hypothetical protein RND71_042024 [Anisodus tanguticus]|uniref:RRP12 HEAT domain-containing protein n=1 Tax=Anisodus tanguticus TaxID=243964 RepID=A0AAE1UNR6_9SOLA|nr:hypothetical protein RND71_042024 [Anisodus tanguticus]
MKKMVWKPGKEMVRKRASILGSEHEEAIRSALEALKSLIHECIDENLIKQDHYSPHLLKGTLQSLVDMQKLPDEAFPYHRQLHECVGSAVGAMGPDSFLTILPLKLDKQNLSESNLWLFPIIKQTIIGAHLRFFSNSILSMVGAMKQRSARFEHEGKIYSAQTIDGIVYSLWSLLPSFCNYPVDTAESFKALEKILCKALREEPDFADLIQQNKSILEGKVDFSDAEISIPKERAIAHYNQQVAGDNLNALGLSARELLAQLFDLAVSLLPGLDAIAIDELFDYAIEPALKVGACYMLASAPFSFST